MSAIAVNPENSQPNNDTNPTKCIICGENSSSKIVKDENFIKMMCLYWEGIEMDVKPIQNKDFDLCAACFYNLKTFYETNDICMYFESNMKILRRKILCQNLKGILKRHEEHIPLLNIHTQIQQKWGTKLEPVDKNNALLQGYKVTTSIEADKPEVENHRSSTTIITRSETVSQPSSSSSKEKEQPSQPQKRAQSGSKPKTRSRRKKARKSVWSSSSEDSTEELSDDSS